MGFVAAKKATTLAAASSEAEGTVKAHIFEVGSEIATSNAAATTEDDARVFTTYGAILPPYDPRQLAALFERSTSLRPNVEAYEVNIEAFGHRFDPTIALEADDADEKIAEAIMLEKLADGLPPRVDAKEVDAVKMMLPALLRIERIKLEQLFNTIGDQTSFVEIRKRLRRDLEVTGNSYLEILRNREGTIQQVNHIPSPSMRLLRAEIHNTTLEVKEKVSALDHRLRLRKRRLRFFVQVLYGQFIAYFKELGDPRIVSCKTGKVYETKAELEAAEPNASEATEIVHFKVYSPLSAYGVPRWVGATLAVIGSRNSEEVNVTFFDNKAVPPMAILVSGGSLAHGAADRINTYIRDNIKGKDNFHKILVLEAEPAKAQIAGVAGSRVRIEMKPLMDAIQQDAFFQKYEEANTEKVGQQFRLPKLLRGDMKDFNRATADAALDYAEQQVFAPERNVFDFTMNDRILIDLGVRYHRFCSNGVQVKDQQALSEMIVALGKGGALTPNEMRKFAAKVLGEPLPTIEEDWTQIPFDAFLAKIKAGADAAAAQAGDSKKKNGIAETAKEILELRAGLLDAERKASQAAIDEHRDNEGKTVVTVPQAEFDKWVVPHPQLPANAGEATAAE